MGGTSFFRCRLRPRPLITTVPRLTTLADVRTLIEKRYLPAHCRDKAAWRYVRQKLEKNGSWAAPQPNSASQLPAALVNFI